MQGWVKLHRKLIEKAFYSKDSEKVHLWIHLLMKANHSGREEMLGGKPIYCKSGQFTIGRKQLSIETGISESKIQRILTYFEKIEHQIEQQTSNTNRLISILNWGEYQQSEQLTEQQLNNDRTTTEQQLNNDRTHYKNDNKEKNYNNVNKYKRSLLSEIEISDLPEKNKIYLEPTKKFIELFKSVMESRGIESENLKKVKGSCIDDMRLLKESDKRTKEEIQNVYTYLKNETPEGNGFAWKNNIQSIGTLRKKFEKVLFKANEKNGNNGYIQNSGAKSWSNPALKFSK